MESNKVVSRHSKPKIVSITELPEDWRFVRNKEIFFEFVEKSVSGEEELLTVSHITGVTPRSEKKEVYMFLAESLVGYKTCEKGDLIINTMWAFMGALGFSNQRGCVSPSYNTYRIRDSMKKYVDYKYLDYLYRTSIYKIEIYRNSKGVWTSRLRLYPNYFLRMYSIIPPLDVQKSIVNFLNYKIFKIKSLIQKKEYLIELMKERRQLLISHVVTKGLDESVFLKDSNIKLLGSIPNHWKTIKLKHISNINSESLAENTNSDYEFYYVEIGNVTIEGLKDNPPLLKFENAPSRARRIIKKNDVILSTVRTYLKAITWFPDPVPNLIASTGFAVITPDENINPNFLYFFIRSNYFVNTVMANSVGINYPAINNSKLINLKICYPPLQEQNKIVEFLNREDNKVNQIIENLEKQIELIKKYRQAELFSKTSLTKYRQ